VHRRRRDAPEQLRVEHSESRRGVGQLVQALGQQRGAAAEQVLEPDGPLRQLPGGDAGQPPQRRRLEVHLDPACRSVVAHPHRAHVDAAGERAELLSLDAPALVQIDDHDDARARRLGGLDGPVRALREIGVLADDAAQRRVWEAANQPHGGSMPERGADRRGWSSDRSAVTLPAGSYRSRPAS
jgi:hypothetical protein